MCFQTINKAVTIILLSVSQEKLLLPLVWWPTASWEGNWAQPERRPGVGRHAPGAALPALCPSPLHFPDYAQSDPERRGGNDLSSWTDLAYLCILLHVTIQRCDILKRFQLTFGYLECLGQPSMATMILWPASVAAWRVSMRMRGIRRSAGVKRWRVDWMKKERKGIVSAEGKRKGSRRCVIYTYKEIHKFKLKCLWYDKQTCMTCSSLDVPL